MPEGETEDKATSVVPSMYITYQLPREPCSFSGLNTENAEKWKNVYEKISNYNNWDETIRRKVDKNMPKDQNISHLMQGVAEELYQVLINREVSTVDKFVTCCREMDAMRKKRAVPLRYERLPNVTPISMTNEEDISDLI
ncbi:retrotrans_gag domain-containing protein [Trichonephila inaurata madagascariensis]|uniref:Retrotrans_gag domain-containing protein n=1 Tax=Trichonephila inaurata madagascariensis TaxID=2747483 RepID=A0A8X7C9F2_9ARAC|nr:retrotrans_gag domain-containing protein [Trichonephila inaurata madagascariensis]